VGYEVLIPISSYDRLPAPEKPCHILTHDYIREDQHTLFGFMTEQERDLFLRLLAVSGVGPKIALSALSGMSVRDFKRAIVEGDVKRLSSISGIGKKMAERIAVELKHKITAGEALEATSDQPEELAQDARVQDAVMALTSLGYKQADAWKMVQRALKHLKDEHAVEDLIRLALTGR
jgi:Holliday junction DNA helicase RuvA